MINSKKVNDKLSELKEMIVNNKQGDESSILEEPILENIIELLYHKEDRAFEVISKKDFYDKKVNIKPTKQLLDLIK